ncbi:MAG: hypothetical protein FJ222_11905 [Lentisphaerae bacterium]|nr:hypothetical protein [Lentisphaerota bacterium]
MNNAKRTLVAGCVALGMAGAVSADVTLAGAVLPPPQPAADADSIRAGSAVGADSLEFLNKDKLHGSLIAVAPESGGVTWKHGSAEKTIDFNLSTVMRATLGPRKVTSGIPSTAAIYLTNGDMLPGNIVSLDGEKLVLDTWYAGKITIARLMIKSMAPNIRASTRVYEGPTALSEWTIYPSGSQVQWRFKDGALYAAQQYPIGRIIEKMPDTADIRFDAAWRSAYPQFSCVIYTDNVQENRNGYMLQVSGSSIYMQRLSRNSGSRNLERQVEFADFSNGKCRSATFNLLVSKSAKTITLLLNGRLLTQWTDTAEFAGQGNGLSFRSNTSGDLKISNIMISDWDGKTPELAETGSTVVKDDLLRFINNDKVSGHLKSISGDAVKFETSYATLDIPLARVVEIVTSTENAARARKNKEDVQMVFADKGLLTLQLERIEKDEVKGQSENFGKITLPLGALRRLDFNIYAERQADEADNFAF